MDIREAVKDKVNYADIVTYFQNSYYFFIEAAGAVIPAASPVALCLSDSVNPCKISCPESHLHRLTVLLQLQMCIRDRMDTAEIFHLWVIQGHHEDELPLQKAGFNVIWTDNVDPYKKRKVRIFNGAHTSMVLGARLYGLETVGPCLLYTSRCV